MDKGEESMSIELRARKINQERGQMRVWGVTGGKNPLGKGSDKERKRAEVK